MVNNTKEKTINKDCQMSMMPQEVFRVLFRDAKKKKKKMQIPVSRSVCCFPPSSQLSTLFGTTQETFCDDGNIFSLLCPEVATTRGYWQLKYNYRGLGTKFNT